MSMPYQKTVSAFACVISLAGTYGCQSAQQKVYEQASRSDVQYHSAPYTQMESEPQGPGQYLNEPAPAPVDQFFPPAAPPSMIEPQPERQSSNNGPEIRRTSQEEFADDQEYFKSVFNADPVEPEPAQKHLGLVPRYSSVTSSVSNKVKSMNGKVKDMYSKMKSHVKTPEWIRKVSGSHVVVQEEEVFCPDMSCVETTPVFEEFPQEVIKPMPADPAGPRPVAPQPMIPQPKQLQPVLPQPEPEKKDLPRLPPPGETTHWDKNWRVSATLEQLPVEDYSTLDDQLEQWPHAKTARQSNVRLFSAKQPVPVETQQFAPSEPEQPTQLTVPSMISQEENASIRKIGLHQSQAENGPRLSVPQGLSPYTPLP